MAAVYYVLLNNEVWNRLEFYSVMVADKNRIIHKIKDIKYNTICNLFDTVAVS